MLIDSDLEDISGNRIGQPFDIDVFDKVSEHLTKRTVSIPLAFYPTLLLATAKERADYEICHSSVHWPKLDCDISSDCLLRGAKEARRFASS